MRHPLPKNKIKKIALLSFFLLLIIGGGIFIYKSVYKKRHKQISRTDTISSVNQLYLSFVDEIYAKIKKHYWNKITDKQLSLLYKTAAEKITDQPQNIFFEEIAGVNIMVEKIISPMKPKEKKDFVVKLSGMVLANLEPFGRSGLFNQQQAQQLENAVSNIDPNIDLYQILGVSKQADADEIKHQYQQKTQRLTATIKNPASSKQEKQAAQKKLALVKRAYATLSNQDDRARYNQTKIESAVDAQLISPQIFYIHIKKMSPTSFEEFQKAVQSMKNQPDSLNTLILDLRGNVGGSVDLMQWFLGPFIGQGNLAYEFYHQGDYKPFKTKIGWLAGLVRYKKVVILIDNRVQSSGEVMTAALKKYNVGVLVGTTTKGWGTIEKIFPLEHQLDPREKYSMFLVHSLTLRDDHQPIEGRGIDPDINITQKGWEKKLLAYFNSSSIVKAVKQLWFNQP